MTPTSSKESPPEEDTPVPESVSMDEGDIRKVVKRESSMTVQEVFGSHPNFETQVSAMSDTSNHQIAIDEESTPATKSNDDTSGTPTPSERSKKTLRTQTSIGTSKTYASVTFGGQGELPPLPIPSLGETLNKFLQALEPLQEDAEEREETKAIVLDFLKNDGPKLQEILVEYDRKGREQGEIGSYVEEFWNDSYLAPDASVVLNLNPFFVLEDSPDPKIAKDPIKRAASLCFASVKLASQLRNETLRPDTFKGKPLCMDQFKALFSASRVPMRNAKDAIHVFDKSNHVAVMCNSQLYYFQALWPDGDVAVDEDDLVDILSAIQDHSRDMDPLARSQQAIGVLTSLCRKEWARAREELWSHSHKNQESLQIIDSALFVLVLDDYIPKDKHDAAANMLHGSYKLQQKGQEDYQAGSCCNRWYDKLQIIVCGDATAGINFEHSAIDGHTALRFVSDIYADTVISFAQSITKLVQAHDMIPNVINAKVKRAALTLDSAGRTTLDVFPKKIPLDLPESIVRKIYFAETALGDQIVASETHVLEFKEYGKTFITGNKLSPDSFVQMSMMLAYYKLYGRIVCAYEPVLTKSFYHGRTEAMRPATMEAKHLCEVFCNPKASAEQKLACLREATKVHSALVRECARGKGVDRHLFALKSIAEKYNIPIPAFFHAAPWKQLNHTVLSTSNCGNPSLALFGFGPVVPDGLGIGYIIKDYQIHYSISSKHRQTTRYALTLESVLRDLAKLMQPLSTTKVLEPRTSLKSIPHHMISWDSYGDIWGESTPPPSPKPNGKDVVPVDLSGLEEFSVPSAAAVAKTHDDAFEAPAKREWHPEPTTEEDLEYQDPDQEAIVQINDGEGNDNEGGPRTKPKMKRRGSKDLIPTVPSRRGSVANAARMVGPIKRKPSFEYRELSQKGTAIVMERKDSLEATQARMEVMEV